MLELGNVLKGSSGLVRINCDASISPLFLLLHFIEDFAKRGRRVVFLSGNVTAASMRVICGKMALRIDWKNFYLIHLHELLSDSLVDEQFAGVLEKKLLDAVICDQETLVIFDDFDSIHQLCDKSLPVLGGLQLLLRIRRKLSANSLILVACEDALDKLEVFSTVLRLVPIGSGFGSNVTGENFLHLKMTELPPQFLGKFKVDRSENFDEYLASRGVNWILRKLICFTSVTKVFQKSSDQEGRYNMENLSSKENTVYNNWALGETFEGKGLDGKQHKITFNLLDGSILTEHHLRLENSDDKGETYQYTVQDNQLVLKLENDSVVCRRFFKKID